MRPRTRRFLSLFAALFLAALAVPTVAAADAATPVQRAILDLFFLILVFALIVGVLVEVLIVLAVKWFRDSPRWRPPKGPVKTHDLKLELGWTAGPIAILVIVTALAWSTLNVIERPPAYDYVIEVQGVQWAWLYKYPDYTLSNGTVVGDISSTGKLYLQEDLTYLLHVTAPGESNVIHSFYVPDLGIKIDAVPGTTNVFWVRVDYAGVFTVQCAEFCGQGHSEMHGEVVVFAGGTQEIPYGPPPSERPPPPPPGDRGVIVDVWFRESGGPSPSVPWSMEPNRLQFGQGIKVTLRIWNNETTVHGFQMASPYEVMGPNQMPGEFHEVTFWTNFTTDGTYFWCHIPSHRPLGMQGTMNVTGPRDQEIVLQAGGLVPARLDVPLGQTVNVIVRNNDGVSHDFAIGPPYDLTLGTVPAGATQNWTVRFDKLVASTWFGSASVPTVRGTLTVTAYAVGPRQAPPRGFPVIEVTALSIGAFGAALLGLNWKLGRDAKRRKALEESEE